jgi:GNAT superfamily N-acetyltransferase
MAEDILERREQLLQALNSALPEFLAGRARVAHIGSQGLTLYMRRSRRPWQGGAVPCLDVGSIELHPTLRGAGVGKRIFDRIEAVARGGKRCVYVENVLNPVLERLLLRRGIYVPYTHGGRPVTEGGLSYLGLTAHPADCLTGVGP